MPRNLNKTPCHVPGCRSWAMRGHTHCRAHRDDELGPRGAGPPSGNLNALKHGHHAQPLPLPDVKHLARQIIEQPDDLPFHIGLVVQSLQARTGDPLATLIVLRRLLSQLANLVATGLLASEFQALLQALPPELHARARATVAKLAPRRNPIETIRFLRNVKKQLLEQNN